MTPIKTLLTLALLSSAQLTLGQSRALAQDCTIQIANGAGMADFWGGRYDRKIESILSRKGYRVVAEQPAAYTLRFGGGVGFVCGTGLTFWDSVFNVEYRYRVHLSGPSVEVESRDGGEGFLLGLNARLKNQAIRAVRHLPNCGSINPHDAHTKIEDLGQGLTQVTNPSLKTLIRESAGDVVYFGAGTSGQKICDHYHLGEYVPDSKITLQTRAISTRNRLSQAIVYRMDPLDRLSQGYQYPQTHVVKSVVCQKR
jgi:hypothetical protein